MKKKIIIKSYKGFNFIGFLTLYKKEIMRFLNVATQTLLAPAITTMLFYIIFAVALGKRVIEINSVDFAEFLAPGLVCMSILQNAFANTSSSLLISKVQGNIVDILMPPLSEIELTLAFALGGITRGILVGLVVALTIYSFIPFDLTNVVYLIYFSLSSALLLSLLGIICGIWSQKFDHMAGITNFIITPLTFLSGTFYSIDSLPEFWQILALLNPFFYIIDGFRYYILGINDRNVFFGGCIIAILNSILILICILIFKKGYKLKT